VAPEGVISYSLDGGGWIEGNAVTVGAPADHSGDGVHDIAYRFVGALGSVRDTGTCQVKIDTTRPDTFSPGVSCVEGGLCRLKFLIVDMKLDPSVPYELSPPLSPLAHATLCAYKNMKVKGQWMRDPQRTVDLGWQLTNVFDEASCVYFD
jgi:hypothetical protein